MSKPRRKPPTLREKLAATLLMLSRVDEHDEIVPAIPREEAKGMTAAEIIGRFEFDHGIYVAWHGGNHPTNLTPRLKAAHREKTKRDRKNIDKVRRAEKRRTLPSLADMGPRIEAASADLRSAIDELRRAAPAPKARMQYTRVMDQMKRTGIPIKGFRIDKHGKIVRDQKRLDVSTRLKQAASKRVRVVRKGK